MHTVYSHHKNLGENREENNIYPNPNPFQTSISCNQRRRPAPPNPRLAHPWSRTLKLP